MPNDRPAWEKEPWYQSEDPGRFVRGATWRGGIWIAAVVAIVAVIGGVWWAVSVATAGVKGTGDIRKQNQSAQNRIYAQQHFEDLNAAVTGYAKKLVKARADLKANPNDSFYQNVESGLFNQCVDAATQYNADTAKALFSDWKSADLPEEIDVAATCGDS